MTGLDQDEDFLNSHALMGVKVPLVLYTFRQQALDNPGDDLCEKNADLIKVGLVKLEGDISDTLTELRYELVDIDSPA